ncbi:MAG: serine O-acetyltransferase [Ilumatobacter sp.]
MGAIGRLGADLRELSRATQRRTTPGATVPEYSATRAELLRLAASHDGFKVLMATRLRESARRYRIPGLNHFLRLVTTVLFSVEIGNEVTIGAGTEFVHTLGTVVGGTSVLGDRVRLMGNNTVGASHDDGCPIIGSDVVIGAGARILGSINVGDGAFVGANAVVVSDVPPGAVAIGIPAVSKLAES